MREYDHPAGVIRCQRKSRNICKFHYIIRIFAENRIKD